MSDSSDLGKRLKALEEGEDRQGRKRPSPLLALAGITGIAAIGAVLYLAVQAPEEERLPTSTPAEFQTDGPGFGRIEPGTGTVQAEPAPGAPTPDPATAELLARIEAMQAELTALREAPDPEIPPADDGRIQALSEELSALQAANATAQEALLAELEERDRELQRLRTDLELAQLENTGLPAPTGPSEEELRLQELERRRQAEREALQARIESPIIAFGGSSGDAGASDVDDRRLDSGTEFVRNGAAPAEVTQAQVIVNPSNTVIQGTMIQAVLETAIDSSLPGQVRALVSEDVHAFDSSRILIPRGSRLIGRYQSGVDIAQQRITIAWDRIILPDNQTVTISAFGGDELGRSGTSGFVDSRFTARFGSAALISLIGALPGIAAEQTSDETASDALEDVAEDLQDSSRSVIGDYLSIAPVIHVDQGSRITVMVDRDLEIF